MELLERYPGITIFLVVRKIELFQYVVIRHIPIESSNPLAHDYVIEGIHMSITSWAIVLTVFAAIFYDLIAKQVWGDAATISAEIGESAKQFPLIPFVFGVLVAHWLWR